MLKTALATLAFAFSLTAAEAAPQGPVLLTVSGAVTAPDRGAFDPDEDKFFGAQDVAFDAAKLFDFAALAALPWVEARADFPKRGPIRVFEGPLLADVLAAAGVGGATVTVRALDGYLIEAPLAELTGQGAVLALKRDGRFFAVGDYGPAQIVFPRAKRADLAEMPDDRWIWSVYHIAVD